MQRDDEQFLDACNKEKEEKAGKCIYEYRREKSCKKGKECAFSHKITDDDRKNEALKKKMADKDTIMKKGKKKSDRKKDQTQPSMAEEMLAFRKEFKEIKEMMRLIRP